MSAGEEKQAFRDAIDKVREGGMNHDHYVGVVRDLGMELIDRNTKLKGRVEALLDALTRKQS